MSFEKIKVAFEAKAQEQGYSLALNSCGEYEDRHLQAAWELHIASVQVDATEVPDLKYIYTAIKGKVYTSQFVKETPKGYRVKGGKHPYEHLVYKDVERAGWESEKEKPFYTERSYFSRDAATRYAQMQVISMEEHYQQQLSKIQTLKLRLGIGD